MEQKSDYGEEYFDCGSVDRFSPGLEKIDSKEMIDKINKLKKAINDKNAIKPLGTHIKRHLSQQNFCYYKKYCEEKKRKIEEEAKKKYEKEIKDFEIKVKRKYERLLQEEKSAITERYSHNRTLSRDKEILDLIFKKSAEKSEQLFDQKFKQIETLTTKNSYEPTGQNENSVHTTSTASLLDSNLSLNKFIESFPLLIRAERSMKVYYTNYLKNFITKITKKAKCKNELLRLIKLWECSNTSFIVRKQMLDYILSRKPDEVLEVIDYEISNGEFYYKKMQRVFNLISLREHFKSQSISYQKITQMIVKEINKLKEEHLTVVYKGFDYEMILKFEQLKPDLKIHL